MFTTLIRMKELAALLDEPHLRIMDCRFSLKDTEQGRIDYRKSHIPGAQYAHLDEDLSGQIISGVTGRHPWPEPVGFSETLSHWGIDNDSQVVVYDYGNGGIAARLWCMLRVLGHEPVAVLDGGWFAWQSAGMPVSDAAASLEATKFNPEVNHELLFAAAELSSAREEIILVDARIADRFAGKIEPIDPVAGHIPGAVNYPFPENLNEDGFWKSSEELRARFAPVMQSGKQAVFYCGSGVTACHNMLAVKHAGFDLPGLYPGSWSEWITDPRREVVVSLDE